MYRSFGEMVYGFYYMITDHFSNFNVILGFIGKRSAYNRPIDRPTSYFCYCFAFG